MLGEVNKDYREEEGGNGFVRPFADEYDEDYSDDGVDDKEGEKDEDQPFIEYDDEDYQSSGIGEVGASQRGDNMLHGNALANQKLTENNWQSNRNSG